MDAFDLRQLARWLTDHRAGADLIRRALLELRGTAGALSLDECEFVLVGLLCQVRMPAIDLERLDAWVGIARRMGYHDAELTIIVEEAFGATVERVWAAAHLRLPVDAGHDDVRATHRALVKLFHPDRLGIADPASADLAHHMLARANAARATLLRDVEIVLLRDDDVVLGDPTFLAEDAPTERFDDRFDDDEALLEPSFEH